MFELRASDIISFSAVVVSLVAVIIGPIVTFKIAKRQIVSPIRQKWIDELRDLISEYLSECEQLIILGEDGILAKGKPEQTVFKRLLYLQQKLRLMLNLNEATHIELLSVIESITDDVSHGVGNLLDFGGRLKGATQIAQRILKEEWVRVKNGDV